VTARKPSQTRTHQRFFRPYLAVKLVEKKGDGDQSHEKQTATDHDRDNDFKHR
jgi:hypothetical protein